MVYRVKTARLWTGTFHDSFPVAAPGSKPYTPGMDTFYGYIRTSRRAQEGVAGMDPATQELQLRRAGVPRDRIYRDVGVSGATGTNQRRGWHSLTRASLAVIPWSCRLSTESAAPGRTEVDPENWTGG